MHQEKNQNSGYLYLFSWCGISALSMILTSRANQSVDPIILSFFSFLLSGIFFGLMIFGKTRNLIAKLRSGYGLREAIGVNVSTFFSWVLLVYPLKYIEPTAVTTIVLGVNPLATLVIDWLFLRKKIDRVNAWISVGIFITVSYEAYLCYYGLSVIGSASHGKVIFSLLCCFIAGAATATNNIFIRKLLDKDFTPQQILSFRFFFTIAITGTLIWLYKPETNFNQEFLIYILATTLLFVIAPLMLIQLALRALEPIKVAIISPVMPLLVAVFQLSTVRGNLSSYTVVGTALLWLLVIAGIIRSRSVKSNNPTTSKMLVK